MTSSRGFQINKVIDWVVYCPTIWQLATVASHAAFSITHLTDYQRTCRVLQNMMTSSNGNIFRVTGHLCGECTGPGGFPAQRPVTRCLDVFFDLNLNQRFSKQSRGWWFETQLHPLWRHCNDLRCCTLIGGRSPGGHLMEMRIGL